MTAPRGRIYYTTDGTNPYQPLDATTRSTTLITENAAKKVLVPATAMSTTWRQPTSYDDQTWLSGSGNVGYEQGQGYESLININVGTSMYNKQTSCYVRIPFSVDAALRDSINILTLRMRYDDGIVVFLNGEKVAEANAPANLVWNAAAPSSLESSAWETFDISGFANRLAAGKNVLAIHGLNVSLTSSDFLIGTELIAGIANNAGTISQNAVEYTAPILIDETTNIKACAFDNVNWSALNEAKLWVLKGMDNLRISEIHYHPLSEADSDDSSYEFIELKNIGDETIYPACTFLAVLRIHSRIVQ
jgi:hypothetical protein